jgi:Glycosyltransferase family 87
MNTARRRLPIETLLLVAVLVSAWVFLGLMVRTAALNHDFLSLYTGASLARDGQFAQLHSPDAQLARERALAPQTNVLVPFIRPAFYAALLAPLSFFEYRAAFLLWTIAQWFILGACWWWGWKRFGPDALLWGALSLPAGLGIAHGQDAPVLLAILIGGYALAERGEDGWAGVVWSLALMKFNLMLGLPLAMLATRRWRMFGGFAGGGAALGLASLVLGGLHDAGNYVAMLTDKRLERLSPTPEFMMNIQAIAANLGIPPVPFFVLGGAVVVALSMVTLHHAPLWRWVSGAVIAGMMLSPHTYGYDATALLLVVWLVLFESRNPRSRTIAAVFATPLVPLTTLAGPPWAAATALVLLLLLGALAWETHWPGGLSVFRSLSTKVRQFN